MKFLCRIKSERKSDTNNQLIEECVLIGFEGSPENPKWIEETKAEELLEAKPKANILPEQATEFIVRVIEKIDVLNESLKTESERRSALLIDAHQRVRSAAKISGVSYKVYPKLPADIIGIYVFLPT